MMMTTNYKYKIEMSSRYKKELRKMIRRGADESKIEYDYGNYGSHRSGLLKFHIKVLGMLK